LKKAGAVFFNPFLTDVLKTRCCRGTCKYRQTAWISTDLIGPKQLRQLMIRGKDFAVEMKKRSFFMQPPENRM